MEMDGLRELGRWKQEIGPRVKRGRNRDLWEQLIQGPANAHIHEDLEPPLQLQRSLLCFPLRMPSSTPNTVRSLFLSFPSPHISLCPPLSFSASVHLLIHAPFLPANVSLIYSFASHLLLPPLSSPLLSLPFLFFSPLIFPTHSLRQPVHLCLASLFGFRLFALSKVMLLILCRAKCQS